ncbi:ECF transporter S component [Clostridium lundense]|uniref:ECF transporter S component n=1 Tax=Clostridium lundense TaxID=319475 RepID=UPI00048799FC|nr:ECF transporter S component [Clostridium lundense]
METNTKELVKASLFLALGLILPYIFHFTGMPGNVFLPMHIPVLLCGLILGERYGLLIGFITPLINSVITGMPPIYPVAVAMAFELAAYGWLSGYLFKRKKSNVYIALILAMIFGRLISGIANYVLMGFVGKSFVLKLFMISAFVKPLWGILIQIIIIPFVVKAIERNSKAVSLNG